MHPKAECPGTASANCQLRHLLAGIMRGGARMQNLPPSEILHSHAAFTALGFAKMWHPHTRSRRGPIANAARGRLTDASPAV